MALFLRMITGGVLNIEAVNNGIKGKDSVAIYDGELTMVSPYSFNKVKRVPADCVEV